LTSLGENKKVEKRELIGGKVILCDEAEKKEIEGEGSSLESVIPKQRSKIFPTCLVISGKRRHVRYTYSFR